DGQDIPATMLEAPKPDQKDDQAQEADMYKVLVLTITNHPKESEWQHGQHELTLINPDGQKAVWPFEVSPGAIVVEPRTADVKVGESSKFAARVTGYYDKRVMWSIDPKDAGQIEEKEGKYTAPSTVPSHPTVKIIATSVADPSQSDTATVTIIQ